MTRDVDAVITHQAWQARTDRLLRHCLALGRAENTGARTRPARSCDRA